MENKKIKVFTIDENGNDVEYEISNKRVYMLIAYVNDYAFELGSIGSLNLEGIEEMHLLKKDTLFYELENGASCATELEDPDFSVDRTPSWAKKCRIFASHSKLKLENVRKNLLYYMQRKAKSPYDCLTFNV